MKKQLNKIVATLLTGVVILSGIPVNSSAATKTEKVEGTNLSTGQVALYQDGALSDAYLEGEWTEQYIAPDPGTFEGDLYQGLKNFDAEIYLADYKLSIAEARERVQIVLNSNPDLFYVSNSIPIGYYKDVPWCNNCNGYVFKVDGAWYCAPDLESNGIICNHKESHDFYDVAISYNPQYITDNKSELTTMTANFDAAVERAMAGISDSMTDFEKALYFHDYIVKSNNYDLKNFLNDSVPSVSHSAYGALVKRVSVCDGYALAYSYLLHKCDIETRLVTSDAMGHAWSAVKLGEDWYFVDCTGDDPISDYTNTDDLSDQFDVVCHDAFLMSEKLMSKTWYSDGPYRGWAQTDIKATSTKYDNAYWRFLTEERGDVNGDGKINADDALGILKYKANIPQTKFDITVADTTGDGNVNADDALQILKFKAGVGKLYSDVLQWGIYDEYGYCDGYWYYFDDIEWEIMRTKDPTQAGEVYSTILEQEFWHEVDDPDMVYMNTFGKASVHTPSKKMYVSTADTVYVIDLTKDGAAEVYLSYSDLGNTAGAFIYGLTVIDDTLYIGIANSPYEKETIIEKPIG